MNYERTPAELQEELAKLKAENERLKARSRGAKGEIIFRVSQKGALSVYGLGRFPVTLYKEQWLKLLDRIDDLKDFIRQHEGDLATKN